MAEPILYMGAPGVGKSSSLRDFNPEETVIFKPNAKSLPFPGGDSKYVVGKNLIINTELDAIAGTIEHISNSMPKVRYVILEDFTHLFTSRIFSENFMARTSGNDAFQRWTDFGASVFQSFLAKAQEWRKDLYIIVIHHTEIKEDGTIGFKSAGKLLDNSILFSSYFTYVFHGIVQTEDSGTKYMMQTNKGSIREAKTPYGVFPDLYIPNNMKTVCDRIDAYKAGEVKVEWK